MSAIHPLRTFMLGFCTRPPECQLSTQSRHWLNRFFRDLLAPLFSSACNWHYCFALQESGKVIECGNLVPRAARAWLFSTSALQLSSRWALTLRIIRPPRTFYSLLA